MMIKDKDADFVPSEFKSSARELQCKSIKSQRDWSDNAMYRICNESSAPFSMITFLCVDWLMRYTC